MAREQSGDADYYRVCATEMLTKAQAATSKAVRRAYLNLAMNWVGEAVSIRKSVNGEGPSDPGDHLAPPGLPKSP